MYESFFGLTGLPFQLNPDPSFLFHGKGHRDAFAALREGLAAGASVIVLTGEVGAGKTTLVQALLASVDVSSTLAVHISVSGLDADTLASRVLEALGQSPMPDPVARRDALLTRIRSGPLATLLVIDEAQHLDPGAFELLEAMARVGATAPVRLQICLVGQPELRFLINAAASGSFRELIGVDRHLRPLEQTEVRLYIEHRLHRAGWSGRPEFEDAAFNEIFIFTGGIPRRVNLLCNSVLLSAWINRQERVDAPAVTRAAAALRGDSSQGAPDLLEVGSQLEHPPTLTEAVDEEPPPPPSNGPQPDDGAARHEPINARLAGLVQQQSPARRRRKTILASVASVAVALAVTAYLVDRQSGPASLWPSTLRDLVAKRATPPPASALDKVPSSATSSPAASSSSIPSAPSPSPELASPAREREVTEQQPPQGGDAAPATAVGDVPRTADASPDRSSPAGSVPAGTPTPSCSGPAAALGLCDTERSSSTQRQ